jgi:LCP family protein required for cell wall assembly
LDSNLSQIYRESREKQTRAPFPWSHLIYVLLFIALVAAGLYLGYRAYTTIRAIAAHTQFRSIPVVSDPARDIQPQERPVEQPRPGQQDQPQSPAQAPRQEIYPDIENKERVNILFMGIDQRPGETTACRTDTMILISISPRDMSASLLSIPRDLWVPIRHPKHPEDRVNTAHYWGEVENYPGGGPELAKDTVQYNLGVPVHYYARLNFTGFEQIIDRIGGIDIDVPVTIHDTLYPGPDYSYTTFHIDAGRQHLDGETALKYARTRQGGGDGDFTRMTRQQAVILAIRDRVLSLPNLPQLIPQLPELYRDMGDSLETDIPTSLMFTLARWGQQIQRDSFRMETIDRRMTYDMRTADGRAVLVYDREKARPIIESLFNDPTPEATAAGISQAETLEAEGASIAVYNGTSTTGLAARVESFLNMQGIDVVTVDNADQPDYPHTIINVYRDQPATVNWLANWLIDMGISEATVRSPSTRPGWERGDVDVSIVIGADFPVDKVR